ncbi:MAG: 5'-methylthioadenosine/S-adenosylhomocysteine nucleosidase [Chloroflexi bacterium]|nr:5'-methylthioadenosine/S-adenosylhomocysteine nucleosidase [Chloroflexota bacterium]
MGTVVIVSANIEWQAIRRIFPNVARQRSPYGQWFTIDLDTGGHEEPVLFFHGGWGKIAAAASAQYAIDRWSPALIVNIGTCGGFAGEVEKGTIILVERTIVYDIVEQMGDYDEHIAHYTTDLDLSWLDDAYPQEVYRTLLVSGDRDLLVEDIPRLKTQFGAVAGDWESGAIAWVAARNGVRCLILRGVSDLVGSDGGEAYEGNIQVFAENAAVILERLVHYLPAWIADSLPVAYA